MIFGVMTSLAVLSRGLVALKPTRGGFTSAVVNLVFLKMGVYVAGLFFFLVVGAQTVYESFGLPQIPREFWDGQNFWVTAFCVLFVYDFSVYWAHRFMHGGWLWPMHAVHHSDKHLHFLSWSRGHPVEQAFMAVFLVFSSTWMGLSVGEIAGIALIRALSQYYVHTNIDWDHGPLKYIFVSPRMHRWHHVDHPDAYDKNFGSIFSIFDVIFGTYYNPHSAVDMPTGYVGMPANDLVKLFTHPFTEWWKMGKAKFGSQPTSEPAEVFEAAE